MINPKPPKKRPVSKAKNSRILLKLSGEVLRDATSGDALSPAILNNMAKQIQEVCALGVQVGVVIGGGNIFRGMQGTDKGVGRAHGDNMGMLATIINSLALQAALEGIGVKAKVLTAPAMPTIADQFTFRKAIDLLNDGYVVILGGGTGNPFFTTDSAAALRAAEIQAGLLLKATKVDGIYDSDPVKNPKAVKFNRLTYSEALSRRLKVMDSAAFSLCMDNKIPIIVFDFFKPGEMLRVVRGQKAGTLVTE